MIKYLKIILFCLICMIFLNGCVNNNVKNIQEIQYNWNYIKTTYLQYLKNDKNITQRQRVTRNTHITVIDNFIENK